MVLNTAFGMRTADLFKRVGELRLMARRDGTAHRASETTTHLARGGTWMTHNTPAEDVVHEPSARERLIFRIQSHNPSAPADWLDTFTDTELRRYHEHLQLADTQPAQTPWVRDAGECAVVGYICGED